MKNHLAKFFILAILLISVSSCKKLVDTFFAGETVALSPFTMTVPAILFADSTQEINAGSFTTYINVDSTIRANTNGLFGIKDVSTITVKQITISVTNADEANNLSSFKSFRITISSNNNTTVSDMLDVNIPAYVTTTYTESPSNPTNIVGYMQGNTINNSIYGAARSTTTKSLNVVAVITLFAK